MTNKPGPIAIYLPLLVRVLAVGFLIFWLGAVVWTTIIRHHGPSVVIGIVFVVFGVLFGYRVLRVGVRSNPDGSLTVRNNLGSRHLTRAEVEDFRVGTNSTSRLGQRSIQALLSDGTTYALDVTRSPFGFREQKMAQQIAELTSWLRTGT